MRLSDIKKRMTPVIVVQRRMPLLKKIFSALGGAGIFALIITVQSLADTEIALPEDVLSVTFYACDLEQDRYLSCKAGDKKFETWLRQQHPQPPGASLTAYVYAVLKKKQCRNLPSQDVMWVNGVFLSFDTKSLANITCPNISSELTVGEERWHMFETLTFLPRT